MLCPRCILKQLEDGNKGEKMKVIYYPSNKNCYKMGDIAIWAKSNNCDYVVEIHRNAGGGKGSELLINASYNADTADNAVLSTVVSSIPPSRGIKKRSDLANINRMADTGISYSLVEIGFIDNAVDNTNFVKNVDKIGKDIFVALEQVGVKTLGVIYGHGAGDPGAVSLGRKEVNDVRLVKIQKGVKTTGKTVDQLALEVWQGKWGNGQERINRLTAAGHNSVAVQTRVNQLYG